MKIPLKHFIGGRSCRGRCGGGNGCRDALDSNDCYFDNGRRKGGYGLVQITQCYIPIIWRSGIGSSANGYLRSFELFEAL